MKLHAARRIAAHALSYLRSALAASKFRWMVGAIQRGVTRPGKLERYILDISAKVLTKRLRKLLYYGLITRKEQPGPLPRPRSASASPVS